MTMRINIQTCSHAYVRFYVCLIHVYMYVCMYSRCMYVYGLSSRLAEQQQRQSANCAACSNRCAKIKRQQQVPQKRTKSISEESRARMQESTHTSTHTCLRMHESVCVQAVLVLVERADLTSTQLSSTKRNRSRNKNNNRYLHTVEA